MNAEQQKGLWGRVADISRDCTHWGESSPDTDDFTQAAMDEFIITPRPGIKGLVLGDVLYSEGESVTIVAQWEVSSSTDKKHTNGVHFPILFRDGDRGSDGRQYYLTPQL